MAIDLQTANDMLDLWIKAEKAILSGQAYEIGDKKLTRVNMSYVRDNMRYWESKVNSLTKKPDGRKGIRMQYGVFNG